MKITDFLKRGRDQNGGIEDPDSKAAMLLHELIHVVEEEGGEGVTEMEAEMLHGGDLWHMVIHKHKEGDEHHED